MTRTVTRVHIEGPVGRLAGLLHRPGVAPAFAAVVSHPHPLFGGTMDNKVAYRVARALEDSGGVVLRYDFRGAGGSAGTHDQGAGEQDDLRAALAYLRAHAAEGLPTVLAGFSFGASMSAKVGVREPSVDGLMLVGLPLRSYDFAELRAYARPVGIIQGDRDEHGSVAAVEALVATLSCPVTLRVVPGANHFFDESQDGLVAAARDLASGFLLRPAP